MKKYLLLVAVCCASARAQVTTDGSTAANNVPKFSNATTLTKSAISEVNGNVGIGTTSPGAKLDVEGGWAVSSSGFYNESSVLTGMNNGNGNGSLYFRTGGVDGKMVILNSGQVGIGTLNPGRKVTIQGNGGTTAALAFNNSSNPVPYVGVAYDQTNDGLALMTNNSSADLNTTPLFIQRTTSNIGIGTTAPGVRLEVNGNIKLTSGSGASISFADGTTQSTAWSGTLCGGDYAESVDVSGDRSRYEPGDVMVIDPDVPGKFLKSAEPYSTSVAGIYSTKPGMVGRRQTAVDSQARATEVPMAMVGIVPTKVSAENGPIKPGDTLVTSSTLGHAMKGTDRSLLASAVVGKALGRLESGTGVIEVLVSLQ